MTTFDNRLEGKSFEDIFEVQAKVNGLLVKRNWLSCRKTWGSRVQIIKSQLDFTIVNRVGKVGYFDTKSFESDYFTYSQVNNKGKGTQQSQIEIAAEWNEWRVPAGFVVLFRKTWEVIYFPGSWIVREGPGTRFSSGNGFKIGRLGAFDIKLLMS